MTDEEVENQMLNTALKNDAAGSVQILAEHNNKIPLWIDGMKSKWE